MLLKIPSSTRATLLLRLAAVVSAAAHASRFAGVICTPVFSVCAINQPRNSGIDVIHLYVAYVNIGVSDIHVQQHFRPVTLGASRMFFQRVNG